MRPEVRFPNWQSRLFLSSISRKQPIYPVKLPVLVERYLQWYELNILKVDISSYKVDRPMEELEKIFEFCELPSVPKKEDEAFWKKIDQIGAIHHLNKYSDQELIESICRDNLRVHGYLS